MSNTELALSFSLFAVVILMLILSVILAVITNNLDRALEVDSPTPPAYDGVDGLLTEVALQEVMIDRGYLEPTAPIDIIPELITESSTIHH